LDFAAPHKQLAVVKIISARTNSNVPVTGAPLPPSGSLAICARLAKLFVDLRTSSSLGRPSIQFVHDYNRFLLRMGSIGSQGG
jgi:hypothetical protein